MAIEIILAVGPKLAGIFLTTVALRSITKKGNTDTINYAMFATGLILISA